MQSKTGLLLPGLFRGNDLAERYMQQAELPLFEAEHEMQAYIARLLPGGCPDNWLDWLFYALGAEDYLAGDFNVSKKRMILQRLFEMYRAKGTVKGLGLNWGILAGMELLKADQPLSQSFNAVSLTTEERQAWEANHPEIRIYPFAQRGKRGWAMMSKDYIGRGYAAITDAGLRLQDRVELYDPQTGIKSLLNGFYYEREYVQKKAKNIVEIRKKGQAKGVFAGITALRRHTVNHDASKRLYNIELYGESSGEIQRRSQFAIKPSLSPMKGYYENEAIKGHRTGIMLTNRYADEYKDKGGSYISGCCFSISDARQRIIKKLKLFDPDRAVLYRRESSNYLNAMRIGALAPYHVEAYVDMSSRVGAGASHLQSGHINDYLYQSDAAGRLAKMRWAGNLTRQAGCRVTVSITNRTPLIATMGTVCGRHSAGQYIRRV